MCSVRKHEKWLLIENADGSKEVVNLKRVINSAAAELAIGAEVSLAGNGEEGSKVGKIVAAARDARSLVRLLESLPKSRKAEPETAAEPPNEPTETAGSEPIAEDQDPGDFSSTASSWVPSGESSSSESEEEEEPTPNMKARQYFNKNGKVLTPCNRVNPIIPNTLPKHKNNGTPPEKRKKLSLNSTKTINNTVIRPNSRLKSLASATLVIKDPVIKNEIAKLETQFKAVYQILKELRTNGSSPSLPSPVQNIVEDFRSSPRSEITYANDENMINTTPVNGVSKLRSSVPTPQLRVPTPTNRVPTPKDEIPTPPPRNTSTLENTTPKADMVLNESMVPNNDESEAEGYKSDESNRSDDNILITNKYTTLANQNNPGTSKIESKTKTEKSEWIPIGSGQTLIHKNQYSKINWKSYTVATRTLLLAAFPRKILATHSLTGKRSPAFQNLPPKMCLDQRIVQDVIMEVQDRFHVKENLIRTIITTKCADECKMMKMQRQKHKSLNPIPKKIANIKNEELANQTC